MYAFIPRRRPVARISQGGGGSYSGGKWTLSLKGVSFGKTVDLCTVPYGAFGPRGGATGLRRESISRRTAEMETPDRPVASHPGGGGGLNLDGWNTIDLYRVWLGCLGSWQKQGV